MPRVYLRTKLIPQLDSLIQAESCKLDIDGYALENLAESKDEKISKAINFWEELIVEMPVVKYDRANTSKDDKEFHRLIKLTGGRF